MPGAAWCAAALSRRISIWTSPTSSIVAAPEDGRQPNSMQRVAAVKQTFTVEDVYERASRTLEKCIKHGATRMRTHLELDGGVEMRSFEAIEALRRDYAWAIDVEVCVFPQEGLTNNPRSDELLVEGTEAWRPGDRRGAELRSGPCRADPRDVRSGTRVRCRHRHAPGFGQLAGGDGYPPGVRADREVPAWAAASRLGTCRKLSTMPIADLRTLARRIADAGVAVTVLPATELFMMGRDQEYNVRRGLADVNLLVEAWRKLFAVHQQRTEPVHAVRRCVAAAYGEPAGQCRPRSAARHGCANASPC